jgi:aryl-alcohol dehydrogenase-like predicted oxidoreductase
MSAAMTRRAFTVFAGAALVSRGGAQTSENLITRAIPSSGERLPVVGLGTAVVFRTNDEATRQRATAVLQALAAGGGRLVDTASTYGDAESVLGTVMSAGGLYDKIFIATKLEAPDQAELNRSLARLQTRKIDLLQLHNVDRADQSLERFRAWKAQGICRYVGVTSTFHRHFRAVEAVLRREKPDFVQIDYSPDNREAEKRILPAADNGVAVLTALPFGHARLFRAVHNKPLPDWAQPFAASWAQLFLKFLLGDPRVTAVIPGTRDLAHMTDNLGAMHPPMPDPEQRRRIAALVDSL